jgi:hypothetical protein
MELGCIGPTVIAGYTKIGGVLKLPLHLSFRKADRPY